MKTKTILVCGGRKYGNKERLWQIMDEIVNCSPDNPLGDHCRIIHGGATGADVLADQWAACNWKDLKMYPANWLKYGRMAGAMRNQQMLDEEEVDLVVAFPGGKGTADMVRRARAAGIEVREVS